MKLLLSGILGMYFQGCLYKVTIFSRLINEIKAISKHVAALNAELKQAEDCLAGFLDTRAKLEREIMIKLKTLWIDKDRVQLLRSHYPSTSALSGQ